MFKKFLLGLSLVFLLNISVLARTYHVPSNPNNPFAYPAGQNSAPTNSKYPVYYGPSDAPQPQKTSQPSKYLDAPVFSQSKQYPENPKTLADLPPGTFVLDAKSIWNYRKDVNYSGDIIASFPIIWRKLEDNHYSQGTTLLLSEVEIARYPFCVQGKGIRDWGESDVRKFLNGMFYRHFSTGLRSIIVNTSIPYGDLTGRPKTIQDNVFLLSIVEWDLSDRANNGKAIEYEDMRSIFAPRSVKSYDEGVLYTSITLNNLSRTINRPVAASAGYVEDVFLIKDKGVLEAVKSNYDFHSIRPAINVKSNTLIKGPYKQSVRDNTTMQSRDFVYYLFNIPEITQNQQ